MKRVSRHQAFALERKRETFADWYATPVRMTAPSISPTHSLFEIEEEMIVVRAEGELGPAAAGALSGALGGAAMLAIGTVLSKLDLPSMLGTLVSRGHLAGPSAFALAWPIVMGAGALLGVGFAMLTRRLRNLPALLCFGMLTYGTLWMFIHTLLLRRFAHAAAHALPVAPMVLGAMALGLVTALQLPIRTRRLV